jgi:hypothetical protein
MFIICIDYHNCILVLNNLNVCGQQTPISNGAARAKVVFTDASTQPLTASRTPRAIFHASSYMAQTEGTRGCMRGWAGAPRLLHLLLVAATSTSNPNLTLNFPVIVVVVCCDTTMPESCIIYASYIILRDLLNSLAILAHIASLDFV